MNEGIIYWRSKYTGKIGHCNITTIHTCRGCYINMITHNYFIPVSLRIREIYNQD